MGQEQIAVRELNKVRRVHERGPGLVASLRSLVRRRHRPVRAVEAISFSVYAGEMVGFIGPNGAGKTTTLKMLSGLAVSYLGYSRGGGLCAVGARARIPTTHQNGAGQQESAHVGHSPLDTFYVLGEIYRAGKMNYEAHWMN